MAFQGDSIFWVEVEKIVPNPYQPRREFDENKLQELSESVRMYGVLQPLTVTRKEVHREDGTFFTEYELIAGERRLRASRLAGLIQVPVIIREGEQNEQEKLELAIIENLQREDLNAVDRALAFKQLADQFNLSHSQVAKKVGRSREYVSNSMRLLALPNHILDSVKTADISEGHARTLLMLSDKPEEQDTVYREILLKKLSVREVERIARKIAAERVRKPQWEHSDPALIEFEKQFTESLGTRVQIAKTDYGGRMTIDYFSVEDLEGMLQRLKQDQQNSQNQYRTAAQSAVAEEVVDTNDEIQAAVQHLTQSTPLTVAPAPGHGTEEAPAPTTFEPEPEVEVETASVEPVEQHEERASVPERSELPTAPSEVVAADKSVAQISTPEQPQAQPKSSLAAQLTSLLGGRRQQSVAAAATTATLNPKTPAETQVEAPTAPSAHDVSSTTNEEKVDESNLYSIRNFSV